MSDDIQQKLSIALSAWERLSEADDRKNLNLSSAVSMALLYEIIRPFRNESASDTVKITHYEDDILCGLVEKHFKTDDDYYECPADIFFQDTVPIKNLSIIVDETKKIYEEDKNGFIVEYQVNIFENLTQIVDTMNESEEGRFRCIGFGVMKTMCTGCLFYSMILRHGNDKMYCTCVPENPKIMPKITDHLPTLAGGFIANCLTTWYAIQVCLLNPVTKDMFANPQIMKYTVKPKGGKDNASKRKACYKRIHILNKEALENRLYGGDRKIHRKCLCWYVIGHWREYKDGHKTFVQGFWKGALRQTKMNHDEGREREVIPNASK